MVENKGEKKVEADDKNPALRLSPELRKAIQSEMFRLQVVLDRRVTFQEMVAKAWDAYSARALVNVHNGSGAPVVVAEETLELVKLLQQLFQSDDEQWQVVAKFLKTELEVFRKRITPK
jgi:hypothetical protein